MRNITLFSLIITLFLQACTPACPNPPLGKIVDSREGSFYQGTCGVFNFKW